MYLAKCCYFGFACHARLYAKIFIQLGVLSEGIFVAFTVYYKTWLMGHTIRFFQLALFQNVWSAQLQEKELFLYYFQSMENSISALK